jgi:HK97 gp10 family phage protein
MASMKNKSILIAKGSVKVEGLDELIDVFQQLTSNKKDGKLVAAMRYAMKPLQEKVKSNAPSKTKTTTGALKRSISIKAKKFGRGKNKVIQGLVGPKLGKSIRKFGRTFDPIHYAHLLERGAASHSISPKKLQKLTTFVGPLKEGSKRQVSPSSYQHPGATAKPFMNPALDSKGGEIFNRFAEKMKEIIATVGIRKVSK